MKKISEIEVIAPKKLENIIQKALQNCFQKRKHRWKYVCVGEETYCEGDPDTKLLDEVHFLL
jgi:hypothetical protein